MANVYAVSNGNWGTGATWNTGSVPTAADDVFSNNFTVNVDVSFTVLSLRSTASAPIVAGGSFNFNTAGVTGTVTSASPLVAGATNLVQVTATTGIVTISLGGSVAINTATGHNLISYSGNCNLNLTGTNFNGASASNFLNTTCINKTSAGLITITGNLNGGATGSGGVGNNRALLSTNGNTIVVGNVVGGAGAGVFNNRAIEQSAGTLTVTGNVTGGQSVSNHQGIVFTGTSLTVTGTVLGGTVAAGILTSAQTNIINGNVTAGTVEGITSTSANQIQVTGTVTASASAPAISMTNLNGQVYLNGNMVNNNGKVAIYAPIIWLDRTGTTQAQFFTSGGASRTLYSEDTVPNTPTASDVKDGVVYGAGSGLTGTLKMPVAANVRNGVVYDNGTTGTALFTTSQLLTEINASSDAVAVRMKNAATPEILGEIMEAYKK